METSRKYDKMGRGSKGHSEGRRNPAQTTPGEKEARSGAFRRTPGSRVGKPGRGASDTGHLGAGPRTYVQSLEDARRTDGERQAASCVWNRGGVAGGSPSCTAIACKNWEKLEKKSMELRGQEMLRKKTKHSAGADAMKQVGKGLREVGCTHPERLQDHHLSVWAETPEYPVWNPRGCSPDERRQGECLGVAGCGGRSQAE